MCQGYPGQGTFKLDGVSGHQHKKNKKERHLNDTPETTVQTLHGPLVAPDLSHDTEPRQA